MWLRAHKSHTTLTWTMGRRAKLLTLPEIQKFFKAIFDCGQLNIHKVLKDEPFAWVSTWLGLPTPNKTVAKDDTNFSLMRSDSIRCSDPSPWSNFFIPSPQRGEQSEQGIIILSRNVTECDTRKFSPVLNQLKWGRSAKDIFKLDA